MASSWIKIDWFNWSINVMFPYVLGFGPCVDDADVKWWPVSFRSLSGCLDVVSGCLDVVTGLPEEDEFVANEEGEVRSDCAEVSGAGSMNGATAVMGKYCSEPGANTFGMIMSSLGSAIKGGMV